MIGFLVSGAAIWPAFESESKGVEIGVAVDWNTIESASVATGVSLPKSFNSSIVGSLVPGLFHLPSQKAWGLGANCALEGSHKLVGNGSSSLIHPPTERG